MASPVGSPGVYPIVSNIQPAPGSAVPPGEVVIGARVAGASALVDVLAFVDGEPFQPGVVSSASRSIVFSVVRDLGVGSHEVRIQARDDRGHTGGYRWQFTVGPRQPPPPPTSMPLEDEPLPAFVPTFVAPTRAPRATVAPPPSARPR